MASSPASSDSLSSPSATSLSLSLPDSFGAPLSPLPRRRRPPPPRGAPLSAALRAAHDAAASRVSHLQEAHAAVLRRLEAERDALEGRVAQLQRRVRSADEEFSSVDISDALAAELRQTPVAERSVKEAIALRLHGVTAPLRRELEGRRTALREVTQRNGALQESLEALRTESARARRLGAAREEGVGVELAAVTARAARVGQQLQDAQSRVAAMEAKEKEFDALAERLARTQAELGELRGVAQDQASALETVSSQLREAQSRGGDLDQEAMTLRVDKDYLQRCLGEATARGERVDAENRRLVDENRALERKRIDAVEALLEAQRGAQAAYDARLQEEVHRLRTDAATTLEVSTRGIREGHDRETAGLRQLLAEALRERDHFRKKSDELHAQVGEVQRTATGQVTAAETRASEAEAKEQMRTFEAAQVGLRLGAEAVEAKRARAEVDMLRQKTMVLEKEFQGLQARAAADLAALETALALEQRKTEEYEGLELEMDTSILRTARDGSTAPPGVLTHPAARVRHAVSLAQRLMHKEAEAEKLAFRVSELEETLHVVQLRLEAADAALQGVAQPEALVLQALRSAEEEKRALQDRLAHTLEDVAGLESNLEQKEAEMAGLRDDMGVLLQQQDRLDAMRTALQDLRFENTDPADEATRGRTRSTPGRKPRAASREPETSFAQSRSLAPGRTLHDLFVRHGSDA